MFRTGEPFAGSSILNQPRTSDIVHSLRHKRHTAVLSPCNLNAEPCRTVYTVAACRQLRRFVNASSRRCTGLPHDEPLGQDHQCTAWRAPACSRVAHARSCSHVLLSSGPT